jgi:hypothetical protein
MNPDDAVVKIDLAPKLKRPLSLWNPLDYLRLIYWVFYFPQALWWYEKTFSNGTDFSDAQTLQERWQWLQQNYIQPRLILQSFIILLVINFGGVKLLETLGFKVNWPTIFWGVAVSLISGIVSGISFRMVSFMALVMVSSTAFVVALGVFYESAFYIVKDVFVYSGMTLDTYSGMIFGTTFGVIVGTTFGVIFGVGFGVMFGMFSRAIFSMDFGVTFSMAFEVVSLMANFVASFVIFGVILGVGFGVYSGMNIDIAFGIACGITLSITCGIAFSLAFGLAIFRMESWFIGTICYYTRNHCCYLSHVSPIPKLSVTKKIIVWLEKDWENGLHNTDQILAYTLQFIPVLQAVNYVLATTSPEHLLLKTSRLSQQPLDWGIVRFASASWRDELQSNFVNSLFILPGFLKKRLTHNFSLEPRLDTPARAAAAGFWYLHQDNPSLALKAFLELRSFPYGQEMCDLAYNLRLCDQVILTANPIDSLASISLLSAPRTPHLYPNSWLVIAGFYQVVANIKIVKSINSHTRKSLALNRALGHLDKILKQSKKLVTADKHLIIKIARTWQSNLLSVTSEISEIDIPKPVISPYTIGDPVEGDAFVGRDDIMNQLSELWRQNKSVQSVVLYGHRRMGKTSILRNINNRLGDNVSLAYVNMLLMTNPQGEADILMFICDQIKIATGINIPTNAEFSAFPETTCRRYIQEVLERMDAHEDPLPSPLPRRERGQETTLNDPNSLLNPEASLNAPAPLLPTWEKGLGDEGISMSSSEPPSPIAPLPQKISSRKLIIAIDEFEQIDELIAAQKISPSFLSFLRGLVQISPQIAFAFAGLHTLEERVANYSDPFFATFIPIPVGFLSLGATRQLLANPADPDFPLDYTPETLDTIYQLTAGQPYLTQLVGFQLVRHYNNQVFEEGRTRDPMLTLDDLNTVIQDPIFFDRGRYYFTGVWNQSSQDVPHQQTILTALTPHPTGLSLIELSTITNLTLPEINAALKILERHDVAIYEQDKWRISIELFRRWVANKLYAQP